MLQKPTTRQPNSIRCKKLKIVLLVCAVLFLALLSASLLSISPGVSLYYHAMNGKQSLEEAQKLVEKQNLSSASLALGHAMDDFMVAKKDVNKLKWMLIIPGANIQISAIDHLVKAGYNLSSALKELADIGSYMLEPMQSLKGSTTTFQQVTSDQKREILKRLQESSPRMDRIMSQIELAEVEVDRMPQKGLIRQLKEASTVVTEKVPEIKKILSQVTVAAKILPYLGGYPEQQSYLFLFQNNTELRASGGFLGSYGILKVRDGEIKEFTTDDTYNLDLPAKIHVTPPWQFPKLTNPSMQSWYFRDSNWSPDFPTSAKKALFFYDEEKGEKAQFDGVVAITPTVIEYLLELVGPTTVSGVTFTSDNLTDQLQAQVEVHYKAQGIELSDRKNIVGDLGRTILDKVFTLPREKWSKMFGVVEKSFSEKQALVYLKQDVIEQYVKEQNWGGAVRDVSGDYLMVVDSNMASLKTDAYMERSVKYEPTLTSDGALAAKVTIHYRNTAPGFSWKTTRYRTWTRVYVPEGSILMSIDGNETDPRYYNTAKPYEITEELGKTAFGTFIQIEPREEKDVVITYALPDHLAKAMKKDRTYTLLYQKQPGVPFVDFTAAPTLPGTIRSSSPEGFNIGSDTHTATYTTKAVSDITLEAFYK